jgi:tropinone reductase I
MSTPTPPDPAAHALARFGLVGKAALVTGGTKGIGRACVEELARLGASVFTCSRTQADLDAALKEWSAAGLAVGGCAADCSTPAGRANLLAAAKSWRAGETGTDPGLDVLVLNVGTNRAAGTTSYTDADVAFLLASNFESAFCLARDAHDALKAAGTRGWGGEERGEEGGHDNPPPGAAVVLMSSVAGGPTSMKSGSLYAATKAALDQLARNLAVEWAGDGIRVNSMKPSYTDTPLASRVLADPAGRAAVLAVTPSRRIADPADVAGAVAWLAGPAAVHVTGTGIAVDGGYSVRGFW